MSDIFLRLMRLDELLFGELTFIMWKYFFIFLYFLNLNSFLNSSQIS